MKLKIFPASWILLAAACFAQADGNGIYRVQENFEVSAPSSVVWEVLTDYDQMHRFVSTMQSSKVLERGPDYLAVEQESTGRFWLLRRTVRLRLKVQELAMSRIDFEDVSGKDFALYEGSWQLRVQAGQVQVFYDLKADPHFPAPRWISSSLFKSTVQRLLEEVKSEILRRAAQRKDPSDRR